MQAASCRISTLFILAFLFAYIHGSVHEGIFKHNRVGVIGGGVSGLASALFIREKLGVEVDITVFERANQIGGRIRQIQMNGTTMEMGAQFFHPTNQFLSNLLTEGNFTNHQPSADNPLPYAIWDGRKFVFREAEKSYWGSLETAISLLWRYHFGPTMITRLDSSIPLDMFTIYDQLQQGVSFSSPDELLEPFSTLSFAEYTQERNYNQNWINEFVDALLRIKNPLGLRQVSSSALFDLFLTSPHCYHVHTGLYGILDRMATKSNANIRLKTKVKTVHVEKPGGEIHLEYEDSAGYHKDIFDTVIIASPLYHSEITISGIDQEKIHEEEYVSVHVTAVLGRLNFDYFGILNDPELTLPHKILTTSRNLKNEQDLAFLSIVVQGHESKDGKRFYRISSKERVSDDLLGELFLETSNVERTFFDAAYYNSSENTQAPNPFQLSENLYYLNAMEQRVSTVETQLIAARAIVNHFSDQWS